MSYGRAELFRPPPAPSRWLAGLSVASSLAACFGCRGADEVLARERPKMWTAYGEPLSAIAVTSPEQAALALDADDRPVLAWSQRSTEGEAEYVHVWRWSGSSWQALGAALSALPGEDTGANSPAIAVDPSGGVIVAWEEWQEVAFGVHVARFSEGQWIPLGDEAIPGSTTEARQNDIFDPRDVLAPHAFDTGPALALESDGTPIVGYSEFAVEAGGSVQIARFSVGVWQVEAVPDSRSWLPPALAIGGDDQLWVAWTTPEGDVQIRSRQGAEWGALQTLRAAQDGAPAAHWPTLVVHDDHPVVAWEGALLAAGPSSAFESGIGAARWSGDSAVALDARLDGSALRSHARLAERGGTLALMWYERDPELSDDGAAAYVTRWRSGQWWPVGLPLDVRLKPNSNGGPALCVDRRGRLVIAYKGVGPLGEGMHVVREHP